MGDTISLKQPSSLKGYSVVCDECGAVFNIEFDIISGKDNKKRCARYDTIIIIIANYIISLIGIYS